MTPSRTWTSRWDRSLPLSHCCVLNPALQQNNITFAGAVALAEAAKGNQVWQTLVLGGTTGLPLLSLKGIGISSFFTSGPGRFINVPDEDVPDNMRELLATARSHVRSHLPSQRTARSAQSIPSGAQTTGRSIGKRQLLTAEAKEATTTYYTGNPAAAAAGGNLPGLGKVLGAVSAFKRKIVRKGGRRAGSPGAAPRATEYLVTDFGESSEDEEKKDVEEVPLSSQGGEEPPAAATTSSRPGPGDTAPSQQPAVSDTRPPRVRRPPPYPPTAGAIVLPRRLPLKDMSEVSAAAGDSSMPTAEINLPGSASRSPGPDHPDISSDSGSPPPSPNPPPRHYDLSSDSSMDDDEGYATYDDSRSSDEGERKSNRELHFAASAGKGLKGGGPPSPQRPSPKSEGPPPGAGLGINTTNSSNSGMPAPRQRRGSRFSTRPRRDSLTESKPTVTSPSVAGAAGQWLQGTAVPSALHGKR